MNPATDIILYDNTNLTGTSAAFSIGQSVSDFADYGLGHAVGSVSIPPNAKVTFYTDPDYVPNLDHTALTIWNASNSPLTISFDAKIGHFEMGEGFDGWDMNNALNSMQSASLTSSEQLGHSYLEVQMPNGTRDGCTTYTDYNGQNMLARYRSSDGNFGPMNNDAASSVGIAPGYKIDLYADNFDVNHIGTFYGAAAGSNRLRIHNIDGDIAWANDTASSVAVTTY